MMESLICGLQQPKPVDDDPGTLKEVAVYIIYPKSEQRRYAPLYLAVRSRINIGNLKKRVRGALKLSKKNPMVLILRGAVLKDEEMIPEDMFESTGPLSFTEELYRPKLFMRVFDSEATENDDEGEVLEVGDEDSDDISSHSNIEDPAAQEGEEEGEEDANAANDNEREHLKLTDHSRHKNKSPENQKHLMDHFRRVRYSKEHSFDLHKELAKIECEQFSRILATQGYSDEGSFSKLTDARLQGQGLWIPKKARNRILALAAIINRHLEDEHAQAMNRLKQHISSTHDAAENTNANTNAPLNATTTTNRNTTTKSNTAANASISANGYQAAIGTTPDAPTSVIATSDAYTGNYANNIDVNDDIANSPAAMIGGSYHSLGDESNSSMASTIKSASQLISNDSISLSEEGSNSAMNTAAVTVSAASYHNNGNGNNDNIDNNSAASTSSKKKNTPLSTVRFEESEPYPVELVQSQAEDVNNNHSHHHEHQQQQLGKQGGRKRLSQPEKRELTSDRSQDHEELLRQRTERRIEEEDEGDENDNEYDVKMRMMLMSRSRYQDNSSNGSSDMRYYNRKKEHSNELREKINKIRRDCATDREGYQVHPPTAHLTSRPSPQCCEKHKQDINLQHLELTEVRKHRREADLRAAVATADRLLYKNGFIPRDVLTRIGTQQMYVRQSTYISVDTEPNVSSSSSSSSSRRSRKSSIYQKLPLSSSKIGATGAATGTGAFGTATASERRHSSSFLRTSSHHDSTTQSGPALVLSAHEQDANYQLLVESVLDRCLMDSREQSERLSWAGEKERRTRAANGREWQDRDHNEYLVNLKENQVMSLLNRTSTRSEKGNLSSNINSSRNMSGGTSSSSLLKSRTGRPISAYTLKNSLMRRLASIDGEHRRDTEAATTTGKAGTTGDVKSLPGLRGLAVAPAGESDIMGPAPDIIPQYDANRFVDITVKEYIEDE